MCCSNDLFIYSRPYSPQFGLTLNTKMAQKIQTVLGPIDADELGITFCHEHLSMDYHEAAFTPPTPRDLHKVNCSFSLSNLGWIRQVLKFLRESITLQSRLCGCAFGIAISFDIRFSVPLFTRGESPALLGPGGHLGRDEGS